MGFEEESNQPWTPLKIIRWATPYLSQKGIPNARFDIETLLAFALKIDRLKVYLQFDRPLENVELSIIRDLIKRRSRFEPIQYIIGQREFYGHRFKVSPAVLIPRPETEILVDLAIDYLKQLPLEQRSVLELGTGSGCISISISKSIDCKIWAVEKSEKALELAEENGTQLETDSIQWRLGDWFSALLPEDPRQFPLILSNPPYISTSERSELSPEVKDFEPSEALFSGDTGLEAYIRISENLNNWLLDGGRALFEINDKNNDKIMAILRGFKGHELIKDLQGLPRVIKVEK